MANKIIDHYVKFHNIPVEYDEFDKADVDQTVQLLEFMYDSFLKPGQSVVWVFTGTMSCSRLVLAFVISPRRERRRRPDTFLTKSGPLDLVNTNVK